MALAMVEASRKNNITFLDVDPSHLAALLITHIQPGMLALRALPGKRLDTHNLATYFCANPFRQRVGVRGTLPCVGPFLENQNV